MSTDNLKGDRVCPAIREVLRSEKFYFARTVQYLFVSSVVDVEV